MESSWVVAMVSVLGAAVAVASVFVTVGEGRAARRNAEFLGHRDLWWQRWSWVAERWRSEHERDRDRARLMSEALTTRSWTTADDWWMQVKIERLDRGRDRDDLSDE